MLGRATRFKLIAFAVVSVVFVVYALARFTPVGELFGQEGYQVRLQLNSSGGIFTEAEVTYRGYNIGQVEQLKLTEQGLEAELKIVPNAPKVPSDLQAVVANRSAVGEQYVDLRPAADEGPYLHDGSVIPAEKTETPVPPEKLIGDLDSLASSVPTESLQTVVDESYDAFSGTGPDLQRLMDTARDFTKTARQYLPQTVQLLEQGGTVLDTQNAEASSMRSFSSDLNKLSQTLQDSDQDIRNLVDITPQVASQVSQVLDESGPGLGSVLANLLTTSNLLVTRQEGLEQGLVSYPVVSVGAQTVAPGDGTAHLGLVLNQFDPPPCTKGYRGYDDFRTGAETSPRPPKADAYCAEPKGSPINVRGSQNAPYNGVPVAPSQQELSANANRSQEELAQVRTTRGVPGVAGGPGLTINGLGELLGLRP